MAGCFAGFAADDYRFGFCDNSKSLNDKMISLSGDMSVDAAVLFKASDLQRFSNGTIEGINVGMSTTFNVASVKAWLRDALTGEDIASAEVTPETTPALAKGWNAARFEQPVAIEPGRDYYAGYTLTLSKAAAYAFVSIQSGDHADACWLRLGDGEWTDRSADYGILNLELLVKSDNLPQDDLVLTAASFSDGYIVPGNGVEVNYSVHNAGMNSVEGYTVTLADSEADVSCSKTVDTPLAHDARESRTDIFDIEGLEPEHNYNFTLTVSLPDGKEDETPADNVRELPAITAISGTFLRTSLVEEFTTERCSNCPAAARELKSMYNTLTTAEQQRTAIVCHHAGFGTDSFTQGCDESYLVFYGNSGTFAPGFMFDRVKQSDLGAPVIKPQSANGLKTFLRTAQEREAFYSVDAAGEHDPVTRTVSLKISGKAATRIFNNPRLTVYLTEDDVQAKSQSNGGADYRHNHLIRAYNETWGAEPVWSEDFNYTSEVSLTYPEACKTENMEVIVVLSNYNPDDFNDCEVGNVFKVKLNELKKPDVGVSAPGAEPEIRIYGCNGRIETSAACEALEIYDLNGRRVSNGSLAPGLYLVRVLTAGTARTAKVLMP